jgi:hypothetical protein
MHKVFPIFKTKNINLIQGGRIWPKVFCQKNSAILGTFGDKGTEIKKIRSQNEKKAEAFAMTSYVEQFFNFIRRFTVGSNNVNHQDA